MSVTLDVFQLVVARAWLVLKLALRDKLAYFPMLELVKAGRSLIQTGGLLLLSDKMRHSVTLDF